jgi:hypothetical protein
LDVHRFSEGMSFDGWKCIPYKPLCSQEFWMTGFQTIKKPGVTTPGLSNSLDERRLCSFSGDVDLEVRFFGTAVNLTVVALQVSRSAQRRMHVHERFL